MPMLTRSKAKALAQQNTIVMVSPSATGEGTHTRWRYPESHVLPAAKPAIPSNSSSSGSLSSLASSSSSSLFTSSSSLSSNSSFEALEPGPAPAPAPTIPVTPQRANRPPVTPPRLAPKKLQRSPGGCRWIQENGYTRVVLVEESFTPEAVSMRESLMQIQIDRIAEREMEKLMKQRDLVLEAQEMDDSVDGSFGEDCEMEIDCESSEGSEDRSLEDGSGEGSYEASNFETSYARGDTAEAEERDTVAPMVAPSRRLRRLGPTGTELIDPKTFSPASSNQGSNAVYPEAWTRALRGQPTELFGR
ncbi:hypothetical protein LshimejAT787_0702710 [Lyophyllum shimeji]|uniref:Uncharacterized protein n=1 Tax=Lyophyllum shimeji TaxID=47721 RepID=A0A9P3UR05_LYOSH|nr:hypothetical protein LshimejAT787_0702710 [Lyophyllum shimeji]